MNVPYSDVLKQIKYDDSRYNGLKMDMSTIFGFISLIGPFFIMFMMLTLSIFNSNFKVFFLFDWRIYYVCIYTYFK